MFVLTLTMLSLIYEATNYGKRNDNYLFALLDVRVKLVKMTVLSFTGKIILDTNTAQQSDGRRIGDFLLGSTR